MVSEKVRTPIGASIWSVTGFIMLQLVGLYIQRIAVGWSIWKITQSANWLAAIALADLLPTLIFGAFAGLIIDKLRPPVVFFASQVAALLQGLALFLLAITGYLDATGLLLCATFLGVCNAFSLPSRFAYLALITPSQNYGRVVAINSMSSNAAMFIGPLIGGELLSAYSDSMAYAVTTFSYVPLICIIPYFSGNKIAKMTPQKSLAMFAQIREGVSEVKQTPEVLSIILAFAVLAFTGRAALAFAPSIASNIPHGGVRTLSMLTAAVAVGGLAGGLWMTHRQNPVGRGMLILPLIGGPIALVAYGSSAQIVIAIGGALLLGIVLSINNIATTSAIQIYVSEGFRGRVNSMYNMLFRGCPAIGAAIFGVIAQHAGVGFVGTTAAVILIVLSVLTFGFISPPKFTA